MANKKCPYAEVVPLECDMMYRYEQFYQTLVKTIKSDKQTYFAVSDETQCACDPELCPRYVDHMIKNLSKYKQNVR